MKLKYDYLHEVDDYLHEANDTKHGVKDADTDLYVASIYISGMSLTGTKTQDDKAAENLAKVFAARLDMLEDLKLAVEVLELHADSYRDRGAIRIAATLEAVIVKINETINKTL